MMATVRSHQESDFLEHRTSSVQEFLDYLLPSADHWDSARRGDLAYRGQASSDWLLVPKAFRPREMDVYARNGLPASPTRVVPQAEAEFRAVQQFVRTADASGLHITEAGGRLLSRNPPPHVFNDSDWQYRWPREEYLETLALAQHFGIPTRLLDFTEDPLVAAFFAASSAWDAKRKQNKSGLGRRGVAVWVVDLRFVQALNRIGGRYPERIAEVRVARANNTYLHSQSAFFLVDRGANDLMAQRLPLSIEKAIAERARFWHTGERLAGKKISRNWFNEVPVRQVRLSANLTGELLRELENRGITRASLMPSLDRVVESLEFQRSIQVRATGS